MRESSYWLVASVILIAGGCLGDEAWDENNVCSEKTNTCLGMNLQRCKDGEWTVNSCDSICQEAGWISGISCQFDKAKGTDVCSCKGTECASSDQGKCSGINVNVCSKGKWKMTSCVDICHDGMGKSITCSYSSSMGRDTCICYLGSTGDPCDVTADCQQGHCGNTYWCQKTCVSDADCGKNTYNRSNYCLKGTSGKWNCFPGCTGDAQCQIFGSSLSCKPTTSKDGKSVKVCST